MLGFLRTSLKLRKSYSYGLGHFANRRFEDFRSRLPFAMRCEFIRSLKREGNDSYIFIYS